MEQSFMEESVASEMSVVQAPQQSSVEEDEERQKMIAAFVCCSILLLFLLLYFVVTTLFVGKSSFGVAVKRLLMRNEHHSACSGIILWGAASLYEYAKSEEPV
ncbi:hypothetical protein MTO96_030641 [Rhipicephalus appendiculatus]